MNELIQSLVAVGGIGYINYLFYERISDRNFKTDLDKKFFIGAMTSINYFLYMLGEQLLNYIPYLFGRKPLNNIVLSILLAFLLSFLLTLIFPWLVDKSFWFTNKIRSEKNMSEQVSKTVYHESFGNGKAKILFIYSIPDNQLISSGYSELFSGEGEDFSFKLVGQYWDEPSKEIKTEEELLNFLEEKNIKADIYINFDKKIKIIYFLAQKA